MNVSESIKHKMISYLTKKGCLVFHYDPVLDNFDEAEKEALIKHGLDGAKITTIGLTAETDFLRRRNDKLCHKA